MAKNRVNKTTKNKEVKTPVAVGASGIKYNVGGKEGKCVFQLARVLPRVCC
jgi:hypothetical protein